MKHDYFPSFFKRLEIHNTPNELIDKGYIFTNNKISELFFSTPSMYKPYAHLFLNQITYHNGGNKLLNYSDITTKILQLEALTDKNIQDLNQIPDDQFSLEFKTLLLSKGLGKKYKPDSASLDQNQQESADISKLQIYKISPAKQKFIARCIQELQSKHDRLEENLSIDLNSIAREMDTKDVESTGIYWVPDEFAEFIEEVNSNLKGSENCPPSEETELINDEKARVAKIKQTSPMFTARAFLSAVRDEKQYNNLFNFLSEIDKFEISQKKYFITIFKRISYKDAFVFEDKQRYRYSYNLMKFLDDSLMWDKDRTAFNKFYAGYLIINSNNFALTLRSQIKVPSQEPQLDEKQPDLSMEMDVDNSTAPPNTSISGQKRSSSQIQNSLL